MLKADILTDIALKVDESIRGLILAVRVVTLFPMVDIFIAMAAGQQLAGRKIISVITAASKGVTDAKVLKNVIEMEGVVYLGAGYVAGAVDITLASKVTSTT